MNKLLLIVVIFAIILTVGLIAHNQLQQGSVAVPFPVPPTPTPNSDEGDPDSTVLISLSDASKTIYVPIDQYVALTFPKGVWVATSSPAGILIDMAATDSYTDAAGYFVGHAAGTTTLTVSGKPTCTQGDQCPSASTTATFTIVVEK